MDPRDFSLPLLILFALMFAGIAAYFLQGETRKPAESEWSHMIMLGLAFLVVIGGFQYFVFRSELSQMRR